MPPLRNLHRSLPDDDEWGTFRSKFDLVAVDQTTVARAPQPGAYALGRFARRGLL